MAILDKKLELSDAQSITGVTCGASVDSTNVIDIGGTYIPIGPGTPLYLNIRINTAFVSGGTDTTWRFKFETGAATTLGTVIYETDAIAEAALIAGYWVVRMPIPYNTIAKYIGCNYENVSGDEVCDTGKVDAWISLDAQSTLGYLYSDEV